MFYNNWHFDLKKIHLLSLRLVLNSVVEWHKLKLNVVQLAKKPQELEKEMQLQKKPQELEKEVRLQEKVQNLERGNDRTYFLFFNWNNYDRKM